VATKAQIAGDMRQAQGAVGALFSPDGRRILSWGGSLATIWNAETGRSELALPQMSAIRDAFFDNNAGRVWIRTADGWAHLRQISTGTELRRLPADGMERPSPGGRFVLGWTAGPEARQKLWDVETGALVGIYPNANEDAALSADGSLAATWLERTIRVSPTWIAVDSAADRAGRLVSALAPLAPLEQCEAYVENPACDAQLGETERDVAVALDHVAVPADPAGDTEQFPDDIEDPSLDMRLVVSDSGVIYVFHNRALSGSFKRLEYNRLTHRLGLRMRNGELRDSSVSLPAKFAPALEQGHRIMMVQMDEKTGNPIGGADFPLLVY
jgi:hypothetical protein